MGCCNSKGIVFHTIFDEIRRNSDKFGIYLEIEMISRL